MREGEIGGKQGSCGFTDSLFVKHSSNVRRERADTHRLEHPLVREGKSFSEVAPQG